MEEQLLAYAVECRRYLHVHPEVGFDLPLTTAFVRQKLEESGLVPTDRYGTCSLVAELGPENAPIIALRADMDALPVEEKTGLPFSSCHPGNMHACGHDAHTAVLLAVAKHLKQQERQLTNRIRLIFQPSEEGTVSGAKMMVDNGVMQGVKYVIATHCENRLETGQLGVCTGNCMAACAPISLEFFGKTSHATAPQCGVDAIAMGHRAYGELKKIVAEIAGTEPYIWSVGTFQGGTAHNVVADYCKMDISFRFYNYAFARQVQQAVEQTGSDVARSFGGTFKLNWKISTGAVYNEPALTKLFKQRMECAGVPVADMPPRMSSEDFGWYLTKAPGMLMRFGTRTKGNGSAHQNDFRIDEDGMAYAIRAFTTMVLQGL